MSDVLVISDDKQIITIIENSEPEDIIMLMAEQGPPGPTDWFLLTNKPELTNTVAGKSGTVLLDKNDVGLTDVDNTPDLSKPVSTAQQTALDTKVDKVAGKQLSDENYTLTEKNKLAGLGPDLVVSVAGKQGVVVLNKTDVGLSNVDNTTDMGKPVSTLQQSALNNKVDKSGVKQLTDENYTLVEKNKLAGIQSGAQVNALIDWNSVSGDSKIYNKPLTFTPSSHGNEAHNPAFLTQADLPPEVLSGTGNPPSPTGLANGVLYFKYLP
jgi:hypothetical protein